MLNERITENIVRKLLQKLGYSDNANCLVEEQKSSNDRIQNLLQNASKSGNGVGKPEFILSFKDDTEFLIIIECKADVSKHESKTRKQYKDYAIDGVLLYSNYLSKDYNVMSIAVSDINEKELKISHFLQLKGAYVAREIKDKQVLDYDSYKQILETQSKPLQEEELVKKAIEYNNLLHKHSVPETERNTLISAILIALQDSVFVDGFHKYEKNFDLVKAMLEACSRVLEKNKISDERKNTILHEYSDIQHNQKLTSENINDKSKKKNVPNVILKNLIHDLKNSILPFIKENDFDILGRFYREFIRYAGSDAKTGLVLTPSHITDLFCELADLNHNDIVYDPCCGTGGFLVSAMKYMLNKSGNNINEWKEIKQNRLIGVEERADMFTHACSNMMMRGDGKSNIHNGDCFDDEIIETIKSHNPNKGFLNPPYSVGSDGQLEFIENTLECLVKGGECIAICQMSTAIKQDNKTIEVRKRLLKNHTLEAVFSMPDQLFYPEGVVTSILVFTANIPHPSNKEVFFGYFKDDGHILRKHKGRLDDGSWERKKEHMLNLYMNNKPEPGLSVTKCVKAEDEWCAEAYMETDYGELTKEDFMKTVKNFVAFQFVSSSIKEVFQEPILNEKIKLDVSKWKTFKCSEIFDIKLGKPIHKDNLLDGNIPYITRTANNNGTECFGSSEHINKENAITIGAEGVVASYQSFNFITGNKINIVRYPQINKYSALFLLTILNYTNVGRFNYGYAIVKYRLKNLLIKLPTTPEGKPDWQFMENYIKSLPYTKNLEPVKDTEAIPYS